MSNLASVFIQSVKSALHLPRDADLAERIGVAKSTIASWRLRGEVPDEAAELMERLSGVSRADAKQQFYASGDAVRLLAKMAFYTQLARLFGRVGAQERGRLAIGIATQSDEILETLVRRATKLREDEMTDDEFILRLAVKVTSGNGALTNPDELQACANEASSEGDGLVPQ